MNDYDEGPNNPTERLSRVAPYHRYSDGDVKGHIQQQSESESKNIVAEDDAEILTDGGEPSLVGNTGASEKTDIEADEKIAFELRIGPMSEDRAKDIRARIAQMAGIDPERIEKEEVRIGVDSR